MTTTTTYRCCQHCVDPCPAMGHTKPCRDCKAGATGRLRTEAHHFPPGTVRDWGIRGRRTTESASAREARTKPIVATEPFEIIRKTAM